KAYLQMSNGDGTLGKPAAVADADSVAVGDFNADGRLDFAAGHGTLSVFLGDGKGAFQTPLTTVVGDTSLSALAVGDFNGDGNLDVAVIDSYFLRFWVLLNDGRW